MNQVRRLTQSGECLENGRDSDLVIPIMGPTGSGKSSFIRALLNDLASPGPEVSNGINSCTSVVQHYFFEPKSKSLQAKINGRRVVLVDTPGFDDTNASDLEILRRIAVWLTASYGGQMKVAGIIYIYPIFPGRYTHNDRTNVKVFKKLCGNNGIKWVTFATSRWDQEEAIEALEGKGVFTTREGQLHSHWKDMLASGATSGRLAKTNSPRGKYSAHSLLEEVITKGLENKAKEDEFAGVMVALQEQIVKKKRNLPKTAAARELKKKLDVLMREYNSLGDNETVRQKTRAIVGQLDELKISLGGRIKLFLLGNS
ncbi:hypothetical protein FA15DRAFT_388531 [Coprinopsis marcescibilis]|uniref:G domain-containing protein n=1 Tax=Coprinopsis marcescibilis TaxID=230819 RepID=A0A5C3KXA9_COPMA|nr:hypothetical protein FA15DRAFT_388531 [Coprinopsis marcescibilis]